METDKRTRLISFAVTFGLVGNALLASLKLITGFVSGSVSVLADGIDSSTDVIISLVSLMATRIMGKPSDREHPFGHGRAETMATTILAFVVFFAGAQLAMSSIDSLIQGQVREMPGLLALWVTALSIAGKLLLAWNQFAMGRKANSAMLIANGKNMRNDILISSTVLVGLGATFLLKLPILDTVFALIVSGFIIKTAVGIFLDVNTELMDGNKDPQLYHQLFQAVRLVEGAHNPHRARIRWIANHIAVDVDVEVEGSLSVAEGHRIAMAVEESIRTNLPGVYDIMVHIEPIGFHEANERYGVTEHCLDAEGCSDEDGK